ncbi:MAG: gamma-glutamylcyclotransferase [Gammaproteobacteria bacterium]|nr:gamma-glutamylcyclotransferase [Gammaproteobacteria bacterium]
MDNSPHRRHAVFFYGLYMDPEILHAKSVEPHHPRKALARGFRLRVGNMATLLREPGAVAHGMLYDLTHADIDTLYRAAGLDAYVAEAITVETDAGETLAALCCNLLVPPAADESNPAYFAKLVACMTRLGLSVPAA